MQPAIFLTFTVKIFIKLLVTAVIRYRRSAKNASIKLDLGF